MKIYYRKLYCIKLIKLSASNCGQTYNRNKFVKLIKKVREKMELKELV